MKKRKFTSTRGNAILGMRPQLIEAMAWGGAAKGGVSGAATGASLGTSILPGWGTLIGGVVGTGIGAATGGKAENAENRAVREQLRQQTALQTNTGLMAGDANRTQDWWLRNQLVSTLADGGIGAHVDTSMAAVSKNEVVRRNGVLKQIKGPGKLREDNILIPTYAEGISVSGQKADDFAVFGNLRNPATGNKFYEDAMKILRKYQGKENAYTDEIAERTKNMNAINKRKAEDALLQAQNAERSKKKSKQQVKSVGDTDVIAAAGGFWDKLWGFKREGDPIYDTTGNITGKIEGVAGENAYNRKISNRNMNRLGNFATDMAQGVGAFYNIMEGTKKPQVPSPIINQAMPTALSMLGRVNYNLNPLRDEARLSANTAAYNMRNMGTSAGQYGTYNLASSLNTNNQLANWQMQQQGLQNQNISNLAGQIGNYGAANAAALASARDEFNQNWAARRNMLTTGIGQLGNLAGNLTKQRNQRLQNQRLAKALMAQANASGPEMEATLWELLNNQI